MSLDQNLVIGPVAARRGEFAQLGAELAGVGMIELIQDGHGALPGVTGGMGIGDYGRAAPCRSVDLATLVRL